MPTDRTDNSADPLCESEKEGRSGGDRAGGGNRSQRPHCVPPPAGNGQHSDPEGDPTPCLLHTTSGCSARCTALGTERPILPRERDEARVTAELKAGQGGESAPCQIVTPSLAGRMGCLPACLPDTLLGPHPTQTLEATASFPLLL